MQRRWSMFGPGSVAALLAVGAMTASEPGVADPLKKPGNPSGHTPHQGSRECERRRRKLSRIEPLQDRE